MDCNKMAKILAEEAVQRLQAFHQDKTKGIPAQQVFDRAAADIS